MTEKKEEIVVPGPSKPVTHPEKEAQKKAEKALEEERFNVLQVSRKIGTSFSASLLVAGTLLSILLLYAFLTGQIDRIILSSEYALPSLAVWVFVGITNVLGGFLLMGSR